MKDEPTQETKRYAISKEIVFAAYKEVKKNGGAAGVDGKTVKDFEKNLEKNLYKIWNRMSSGSYFPPAVKQVEIPKKGSGTRKLGIPTVEDRVAQTVVVLYLEPVVDPKFHRDSYGYRKNKSQKDAVLVTRERCWKYDWVIDLDIKGFFDNLNHELLMEAVMKHTGSPWILLYIQRWLKAPIQMKDGSQQNPQKGTPQGGVASPLLANIFLHHAFDEWMKEKFYAIPFARYADDIVVHCQTEKQAKYVLQCIRERLQLWHLELHPEKTKIVYCKDGQRTGKHPQEEFDFLGFTFRQRTSRGQGGRLFMGFLPAISKKASKDKAEKIRSWKIQKRTDLALKDLAQMCNPKVRGWINYYGAFYKTKLVTVLLPINWKLAKWAKRKYNLPMREAWKWLAGVCRKCPQLFAHWKFGLIVS